MDERKMRKKREEMDDFWDIDALIPPRRAPQYAHDTEATEIVLEPLQRDALTERKTDEPQRHFIPPHTAEAHATRVEPDEQYTPANSLLRTVRLYRQTGGYRYYEDFLRDARRLVSVKGHTCPHVPFFSYVPQYSQMNREQLEWYLWWRESFRGGNVLTTDYSYVLLYAYELINLADADPTASRDTLCRLWLSYREIFRQLDGYVPEWLCDLCLLHRLPPPPALQGAPLFAAMTRCALKEFYITSSGEEGLVRSLPVFASNYDFHKSKFCTDEHKHLFEGMIYGALREIGRKKGSGGLLFCGESAEMGRMLRTSYQGAICAASVKRKIAVEYTSFSCSFELRRTVTDVIKHAENRIRAHIGVRSRLSVCSLTAEERRVVDDYLDAHLPKRAATPAPQREEAAYERLYELPRAPLSLENAMAIERASWDTTERLVEAFEETQETVELPPVTHAEPVGTENLCGEAGENALEDALRAYLPFLRAVYEENAEQQRAIAREKRMMTDALADEVNALCAELFGDILLEESGDGYAVIEDYRDTVESLLLSGKDDT